MKIIAIGGGEKLKTRFSVKALAVDKEIIRLSGKASPRFLLVPTASSDLKTYAGEVISHFGKTLHCKVDVLYLYDRLSSQEIRSKILNADIIYVGGGNTFKMMRLWRKLGVDKILIKAAKKGIILSGMSAGGICWFRFGNSDSRRYKNPKADLIRVRGLNLVPLLFCPHYDAQKERRVDLKIMMRKTAGVAIAADNYCAIEIIDKTYRIISSKANSNAYKVYWKGNDYCEEKLEKSKNFRNLQELIDKQ